MINIPNQKTEMYIKNKLREKLINDIEREKKGTTHNGKRINFNPNHNYNITQLPEVYYGIEEAELREITDFIYMDKLHQMEMLNKSRIEVMRSCGCNILIGDRHYKNDPRITVKESILYSKLDDALKFDEKEWRMNKKQKSK